MDEAIGTLLWRVEGKVGIVTLNRPDRMNTLGGTMKADLARVLDHAAAEGGVRALVLTGAGDRAFCAGADIKERAVEDVTGPRFFFAQRATHALFRRLEEFEKPVVAAINGVALGGGLELALACDLRLATDTARLGLPEVRLGVIPAAGGTQRLPRLVGPGWAKQLILTGEPIDAADALRIGLVGAVVPAAGLMEHALALAARIAAHPPLAVAMAKRAIDRGLAVDLDSGLEIERHAAAMLVDTDDRREGMRAFAEKRAPNFTGR